MNDKEFFDAIAREWVRLGGDSEGVEWCWSNLRDKVAELEKEKNGT